MKAIRHAGHLIAEREMVERIIKVLIVVSFIFGIAIM